MNERVEADRLALSLSISHERARTALASDGVTAFGAKAAAWVRSLALPDAVAKRALQLLRSAAEHF
jgi:hypothetical protein